MPSVSPPLTRIPDALRNVALLLIISGLAACGGSGGGGGKQAGTNPEPVTYSYAAPAALNDGWAVGHLADSNIDVALITTMMDDIVQRRVVGIDSVSIVRNDKLVLNENLRVRLDEFDDWINNTDLEKHSLHSTSKSFTSALIGIAIDQGYISDVGASFYELFQYPAYENWDSRKAAMTLDDALTMRFGMQWDEWSVAYGWTGNSLTDLVTINADYAKALLDLPMQTDPGTDFVYNTAGTIAIGQALENAVGVPMEDYAEINLFAPLQIDDAAWLMTPTGLPNGGSGLFLTSRDMAKLGQLFIADGVWQGQQIVSAEWIANSVEPRTSLSWEDTSGYGYQWWVDRLSVDGQQIESYSTRGYGGQYIICVPSLQLVVAFTGRNYGTVHSGAPLELMEQFILPAMQ